MLAGLIPRLLKKLLKGRMELYLEIESGIFRNRTGDENMNLCGVRLVRRQDVPVSLSFLGRELEAGRVTLAAYHKRNGQLLAYQEEQITDGAVAMVVDFDTQEIRAAARDAEGKTIEAQVAVLVETGFMTNHEELMNLTDPVYQEKLMGGVADGLAAYFKTMK